jgi:hypothetical protein
VSVGSLREAVAAFLSSIPDQYSSTSSPRRLSEPDVPEAGEQRGPRQYQLEFMLGSPFS